MSERPKDWLEYYVNPRDPPHRQKRSGGTRCTEPESRYPITWGCNGPSPVYSPAVITPRAFTTSGPPATPVVGRLEAVEHRLDRAFSELTAQDRDIRQVMDYAHELVDQLRREVSKRFDDGAPPRASVRARVSRGLLAIAGALDPKRED